MVLRVSYDPEADAAYLYPRDLPYAYGEDLDHARRVDDAADGQPVGIELLYVSSGVNLDNLPEPEAIAPALAAYHIKDFA